MKKSRLLLAVFLLAFALPAFARNDMVGDSFTSRPVPFANLSVACTNGMQPGQCAPQTDGTQIWVPDASRTATCTGGGPGAWAVHQSGGWSCSQASSSVIGLTNPLVADLDAAGHALLNVGNEVVSTITAGTATITNAIVSTATFVSETITNYSIIAHLQHDGTLNVRVPPFSATGDGTTDDYAAVQAALYAACNTTNPPTGTPLLTATANLWLPTGQYNHSKPFREPCQNLTWYGDGPHYTKFKQSYAGAAVLADSWGTNIVSGLGATDFGSGNMVTVPNGGQIARPVDLAEYANSTGSNNFAAKCVASGCAVSIIIKPTTGTDTNTVIFGSLPSNPGTGLGMFKFIVGGTSLTPEIFINTSSGSVHFTCGVMTLNAVNNIEWDWDKTTYYAWIATPGNAAVACGSTIANSNPPLQSPWENMLEAGGNFQFWPHGSSTQQNPFGGNIYSILLETGTLHTTSYTGPSAKLTNDSNAYILENWDTSLDGFQLAYRGNEVTPDVYLTVWGSGNIGYVSGMLLHDIEFCVSNFTLEGLVINDSNNSNLYNLSCGNAYSGGFAINRQNFLSVFKDSTAFGGHYNLALGDNFSDGFVQDFQGDGADGVCETTSGAGGGFYKDDHSRCTDRGSLRYGRIQHQDAGGEINSFFIDQESGSEPQWVASILMDAPAAPFVFNAGNIDTRNGAPYIIHSGATAFGSQFNSFTFTTFGANAPASSIVQFSGTGSFTPYTLINPALPNGSSGPTVKVPLSNLGPWSVNFGDGTAVLNNETSTGTVVNEFVKSTGAPATAIALTTSDTATIGVCQQYCGTAGTAKIITNGNAKVLMDATTVVAGDWITASSVTAATGHDSGVAGAPTTPPPDNALGYALETGAGSVTRAVFLLPNAKATATNNNSVLTFGAKCVTSAAGTDSSAAVQAAFTAAAKGVVTFPSCPAGLGYALDSAITYNNHTLGPIKISCPGFGTPIWVNNATGGWAISGNIADNTGVIIDGGCALTASQNTGYMLQLNTEQVFRVAKMQASGGTFKFNHVFDLNAAQQGTITDSTSAQNGTALYFAQASAIDSNQNNVSSFRSFGDTFCADFEGAANSNKLDVLSCQTSTSGVKTAASASPNFVVNSEFETNTADYTQVTGIINFVNTNFEGAGTLTTTAGQTTTFQGGHLATSHTMVLNGQTVLRDMNMTGTFTNNNWAFTTCSGNYGATACKNMTGWNGLNTHFVGTSGTADVIPRFAPGGSGNAKQCFDYILNGYANTGAAQAYTYSSVGSAFNYGAELVISTTAGATSCGTYNPTTSSTTFTLPANAAMTPETCAGSVCGQ